MKMLGFKNISEFAEHRKINRIIYRTMTYEEKKELKKYVYELQERNNRKDLIWEYLNEPMETDYFIYISIILKGYDRSDKNENSNWLQVRQLERYYKT